MYVRMYFSVCRWCKQPSTGNPGRGAVLLTVRTANELCSFLPWTGAVSCVSWTCNRGTTEGERERFLLFSLIPNPSWEWSHSLNPILVWELGASYWQSYLFCPADCDKGVHCYRKPDKICEFIPSVWQHQYLILSESTTAFKFHVCTYIQIFVLSSLWHILLQLQVWISW